MEKYKKPEDIIIDYLHNIELDKQDLLEEVITFLKYYSKNNTLEVENILSDKNLINLLCQNVYRSSILGVQALVLDPKYSYEYVCENFKLEGSSEEVSINNIIRDLSLEIFSKVISQHKDLYNSTVGIELINDRKNVFSRILSEK